MFQIPSLATLTIVALLMSQTVFGQAAAPTATPIITFTEHSDTNLTATYTDGSGVTTNLTVTANPAFSTDAWFVSTGLLTNAAAAWFEPFSTTSFNDISGVFPFTGTISVFSDEPGVCPLGCPSNNTIAGPIAFDTSSGGSVSVYGIFNDLGDAPAGVPDTGPTASLFAFSLVGLALLRRKISC